MNHWRRRAREKSIEKAISDGAHGCWERRTTLRIYRNWQQLTAEYFGRDLEVLQTSLLRWIVANVQKAIAAFKNNVVRRRKRLETLARFRASNLNHSYRKWREDYRLMNLMRRFKIIWLHKKKAVAVEIWRIVTTSSEMKRELLTDAICKRWEIDQGLYFKHWRENAARSWVATSLLVEYLTDKEYHYYLSSLRQMREYARRVKRIQAILSFALRKAYTSDIEQAFAHWVAINVNARYTEIQLRRTTQRYIQESLRWATTAWLFHTARVSRHQAVLMNHLSKEEHAGTVETLIRWRWQRKRILRAKVGFDVLFDRYRAPGAWFKWWLHTQERQKTRSMCILLREATRKWMINNMTKGWFNWSLYTQSTLEEKGHDRIIIKHVTETRQMTQLLKWHLFSKERSQKRIAMMQGTQHLRYQHLINWISTTARIRHSISKMQAATEHFKQTRQQNLRDAYLRYKAYASRNKAVQQLGRKSALRLIKVNVEKQRKMAKNLEMIFTSWRSNTASIDLAERLTRAAVQWSDRNWKMKTKYKAFQNGFTFWRYRVSLKKRKAHLTAVRGKGSISDESEWILLSTHCTELEEEVRNLTRVIENRNSNKENEGDQDAHVLELIHRLDTKNDEVARKDAWIKTLLEQNAKLEGKLSSVLLPREDNPTGQSLS